MSNGAGVNLENRISNEQLVRRIQSGEEPAENMLQLWQQSKDFIAMLAGKYTGYAEKDDLIQEGYLGLNAAVEHYDSDQGVTFIHYAAFWIRERMQRYIEGNSMVRLPAGFWQSVTRYKKVYAEYIAEYGREPTDKEIAKILGKPGRMIPQIKKNAQAGRIRSLSEPIGNEEDNMILADTVADDADLEEQATRQIDHEQMAAVLWKVVDRLPDNQGYVIRKRYQDGETIRQVSECMHEPYSRVRGDMNKALRALRKAEECETWQNYYECYISAANIRHIGLETFKRTWTSEVERAVIYGR